RTDVVACLVDMLAGQRATARLAPRRHRRAGAAVVEDVANLVLVVAVQDVVEGGRHPADLVDELAVLVVDDERGATTAAATAVAGHALGASLVELEAAPLEGLLVPGDRTLLPARLGQPVQRQGDADDREQAGRGEQREVQLRPL